MHPGGVKLPWRGDSQAPDDEATPLRSRGVSIYEIDGRLLVRTVDSAKGLGFERTSSAMLDGYPGVDPAALGQLVIDAATAVRAIPHPRQHSTPAHFGATLMAESPTRYRSHRSWQRAARHVSGALMLDRWALERWHDPDRVTVA